MYISPYRVYPQRRHVSSVLRPSSSRLRSTDPGHRVFPDRAGDLARQDGGLDRLRDVAPQRQARGLGVGAEGRRHNQAEEAFTSQAAARRGAARDEGIVG